MNWAADELTESEEGRRLHQVCGGKEENTGADIHVAIKVFWHDIELKGWRSRMSNHAGEARAKAAEDAKPCANELGPGAIELPSWRLSWCTEKTSETTPRTISTAHPGTVEVKA